MRMSHIADIHNDRMTKKPDYNPEEDFHVREADKQLFFEVRFYLINPKLDLF